MEKMRQLQMQVRQNHQEVGDFLNGLDSWESDIKKQDESLKSMKPSQKAASQFPPVRSKVVVDKVKKKKKEHKDKKPDRIKSADYRKWEKLDVDAMMKQVDDDEKDMEEEIQTEVDKLDETRKTKVAAEMKEKGNEHFKNAGYSAAIECYTTGMQADPSNPIFPANRAMAYLKLKKHVETEADCTLALSLDPTYTKAYLRRGSARTAMAKLSSARKDFNDALKIEPGNVQARSEIKRLDELERIEKTPKVETPKVVENGIKKKTNYVQPIYIPMKTRSKKPLVRVEVQEIGFVEKENKDNEKIDLDFILDRTNGTKQTNEKPLISTVKETRNSNLKPKQQKILVQEIVSESSQNFTKQNGVSHTNETGDNCSVGTKPEPRDPKKRETISKARVKTPTPIGIPPSPTTSSQFQAVVKKLSLEPKLLYQYVLQILPAKIPGLLKQQLETETLVPVLKCFHDAGDGNEIIVEYLNQFTLVKRFEMAVLFLSDQEKNDVRLLFQHLETALPARKVDVKLLSKKYGL